MCKIRAMVQLTHFGLNGVTCISKIPKPVKSSACFFRDITPRSDICKRPVVEALLYMRFKGIEEVANSTNSNVSLLNQNVNQPIGFCSLASGWWSTGFSFS